MLLVEFDQNMFFISLYQLIFHHGLFIIEIYTLELNFHLSAYRFLDKMEEILIESGFSDGAPIPDEEFFKSDIYLCLLRVTIYYFPYKKLNLKPCLRYTLRYI